MKIYHVQGGYGSNLAPTKLVGKLLTFIDSTAHRVVGGLPPPVPSTSHSGAQHNEYASQPGGLKVSNSQSTMAMSSLKPSASVEPINERAAENKMPNRSVSEPTFGSAPKKVEIYIFAGWCSVFCPLLHFSGRHFFLTLLTKILKKLSYNLVN